MASHAHAASASQPGFVILDEDADRPSLSSAKAAVESDLGEMPNFDTMELDAFVPEAEQTNGEAAASSSALSTAAVAASKPAQGDDYDPFAVATEEQYDPFGDAEVD